MQFETHKQPEYALYQATNCEAWNAPAEEDLEKWERLISDLAELHPIAYDRRKSDQASTLGCEQRTLDSLVAKRRAELKAGGSPVRIEDPAPWHDPVEGHELLDELTALFRKFVVMNDWQATACALWTVSTYVFDLGRVTPILAITSPDKRCGKTTLLEILGKVCARPQATSSATPAAVYRLIESVRPTLLFDEGDLSVAGNPDLRAILNSGHTKSGASVTRCVGEELIPRTFSTWCPKAIAAIGSLAPTLQDRSISIRLRRKRKADPVTRLRVLDESQVERLRRQAVRWARDNEEFIRDTIPPVVEELNDRAQDNWDTMFRIALATDSAWPAQAAIAAIELSRDDADDDTISVQLLSDIREILETGGLDRISSSDLVSALLLLEERPWPSYKGKGLTSAQLSRLLSPFEIQSKQMRFEGVNKKGYEHSQFEDVFERYLGGDAPPVESTPLHEPSSEVSLLSSDGSLVGAEGVA